MEICTLPTVVFDTANPQFQENRVFNHQHAAKCTGAFWLAILSERAQQKGWAVMTVDMFLRTPSARAVCISEMVTPYTKTLLAQGVVPTVLICGESPNVAWDFYHRLGKHAHPYHHAYVFRGAAKYVDPHVHVQPLYWPNAQRDTLPGSAWSEREYLVMIASNKERYAVNPKKPLIGLRRLAKQMLWNGLQLIDPLFRFPDLYQERLNAISYFAEVPGFRLYGTAWDKPIGAMKFRLAARRAGGKPVDDKLATMARFRFALCFENCVFPGYVTEKIFDCFLAGCIPVYWGAPDIEDFVPREAFIDYRNFSTYAELDCYLHEMTETDMRRYLQAAQDFLASPAFDKFTVDNLVTNVLTHLEQEFSLL